MDNSKKMSQKSEIVKKIRLKKMAFDYLKRHGIEVMILNKCFGFIDLLGLNEEAAIIEERMMEEGKIQERNLACFL